MNWHIMMLTFVNKQLSPCGYLRNSGCIRYSKSVLDNIYDEGDNRLEEGLALNHYFLHHG